VSSSAKSAWSGKACKKACIQTGSAQAYFSGERAALVRLQRPLPVTSSFLPISALWSKRVTCASPWAAVRAAKIPEAPAPIIPISIARLYPFKQAHLGTSEINAFAPQMRGKLVRCGENRKMRLLLVTLRRACGFRRACRRLGNDCFCGCRRNGSFSRLRLMIAAIPGSLSHFHDQPDYQQQHS